MKTNEVILPTEAELRAAYREGENVVVSLFEQIAVTTTQLAERVRVLEDQLAKKAITAANRHPAMDTKSHRPRAFANGTIRKVVVNQDTAGIP
jgi:hypothetical protein